MWSARILLVTRPGHRIAGRLRSRRTPIYTTSTRSIMSNDEDYASFLDKANQDTGSSNQVKDSSFASTKSVDTEVPGSVKSLDAYYMSDTDEPFEPVALKHEGGKELSEGTFADLIGHSGEVESNKLSSWNVKGQYDNVVDAVKKAGGAKHDVQVFRVSHGKTRCEYYVVTLSKDGHVVGVKARAVES